MDQRAPGQAGPQATETAFNADAFYETLDGEHRSRGLNWKDFTQGALVSQSTLTRLGQGKRPDMDSFARLVLLGRLRRRPFRGRASAEADGRFPHLTPDGSAQRPNLDERGVQALETIIRAAYDQFRQPQ